MKRIIFTLAVLVIIMSRTVSARDNSLLVDDFSELSAGWSVTESAAKVYSDGNKAFLEFDTSAQSAKAAAQITSSEFAAVERYLCIEFGMSFSGTDDKNIKTLTFKDDNVFHSYEIAAISKGRISFFGADTQAVSEDTDYEIKAVIDTQTSRAVVYIDGKQVFDDTVSDVKVMNLDRLKLDFKNYLSSKAAAAGVWQIDYVDCVGSEGFEYTTCMSGGNLFKESELESFWIEYSALVNFDMLGESCYGIEENGTAAEFEFSADGARVALAPKGGFTQGNIYRIYVENPKDIFGDTVQMQTEFTFRVVSDLYDENNNYIKLTALTEEVYEGQKAELLIDGASDEEIDYIEIIIDGNLYDTVLSSNMTYSALLFEGIYEISAVLVTKSGIRQSSEKVLLEVKKNTAPKVWFEDCGEEVYFNLNNDNALTIIAEDSDGIERVELYNGTALIESFTQQPYVYNTNKLGLGRFELRAVAYDVYGKEGCAAVILNNSMSYTSEIFQSSDFVVSTDSKLKNGITYGNQTGYCLPGEIDDEHGTSLIIGYDENSAVSGGYSYFEYNLGGNSSFRIEYDMNVQKKPAFTTKRDNAVFMGARCADGTTVDFMTIQQSLASVKGVNLDYNENQWYHVAFEVDYAGKQYRIYIDGELMDENEIPSGYFAYGMMERIRFCGPKTDVSCRVAFDNIKICALIYAPAIIGIGYDDIVNPERIDNRAENIIVYLSGEISADDVDTGNIKLIDANGAECAIAVSYLTEKMAVAVTPLAALEPNMKYKVVIDKSVRVSTGESIGGDLSAEFLTTAELLDVQEVKFSIVGGILRADVTVQNLTDGDMEFYIAASIWKDDIFDSVRVTQCRLSAGMTETMTCEYMNMMEKRAELYILSSLNNPQMLAEDIYSYGG